MGFFVTAEDKKREMEAMRKAARVFSRMSEEQKRAARDDWFAHKMANQANASIILGLALFAGAASAGVLFILGVLP